MTDSERTTTVRGEVLAEAKQLIEGDRNKTYGSPTQNFQNTADLWNVLLGHKLKRGHKIEAYEVATLMVALKLARTVAEPKRDNFVDIAGYAACGHETQVEVEQEFLSHNAVAMRPVLWTGTYRDPEPPEHVKALRRMDRVGETTELLWRRGGNRWGWATRELYSDDEWANYLANELGSGFYWTTTLGARPENYVFEEVPQP